MNRISNTDELKNLSDPAIVRRIGEGLKQLRVRKNITQQQLSASSGINRSTISRLEAGRAATLLTIVQVLRALDALDLLQVFQQETMLSPIQLLKVQEKQRQRASGKSNKPNQDEEEATW